LKYITHDSRGNPSRTLPVVWVSTIGILAIAYLNNWSGTDLAAALAIPAALWGTREYIKR